MFIYRPVAVAAALCAAALPLTAFAQDAPKAEYDVKAEALLQKAADRLLAAQSFSGQILTSSKTPASGANPAREIRAIRTFRVQKPNLVFQEIGTQKKDASGKWVTTPSAKYVSDGKTGTFMVESTKIYRPLETTTEALASEYGLNFSEFFSLDNSDAKQARETKASGKFISLALAPDETFGGVPCSVVVEKQLLGKTQKGMNAYSTTKIYVGKKDDIIRGYRTKTPAQSGDGSVQISDDVLTNVVLDSKIPASVFAVNTTGYKKYEEPKRPELLTAGSMAPDFTAFDKNNKPVKLSDFKGKVVVIDFWASWCPPCKASMPHNQAVASKLQKAGIPVVLLAVDNSEERPAFLTWVGEHEKELNALVFVHANRDAGIAGDKYHVSGIPTQYIVDPTGKIVTSFVGFGGPNDDLENAINKANSATSVAKKVNGVAVE